MALGLKEDRDFAVEDGGRSERCFSPLQDQRMMYFVPAPRSSPKTAGKRQLAQGSRNWSGLAPMPLRLGWWPASPGCRNQVINVA